MCYSLHRTTPRLSSGPILAELLQTFTLTRDILNWGLTKLSVLIYNKNVPKIVPNNLIC